MLHQCSVSQYVACWIFKWTFGENHIYRYINNNSSWKPGVRLRSADCAGFYVVWHQNETRKEEEERWRKGVLYKLLPWSRSCIIKYSGANTGLTRCKHCKDTLKMYLKYGYNRGSLYREKEEKKRTPFSVCIYYIYRSYRHRHNNTKDMWQETRIHQK